MATTKLNVLSQNLCCKQRKHDNIINASFKLHNELYGDEYSKVFLWNARNVLMRMHIKKRQILHIVGRHNQIATSASAKLLDIMYESYGFSSDLIWTIT